MHGAITASNFIRKMMKNIKPHFFLTIFELKLTDFNLEEEFTCLRNMVAQSYLWNVMLCLMLDDSRPQER